MHLFEGSLIAGQYLVRAEIGRGAMGVVYMATNLTTEQDVALKVICPEDLKVDIGILFTRFTEEARAPAQVTHPGVVRVFDAGRETDYFWMTMELLSGQSLDQRLEAGPLEADECGLVFEALAEILQHVHERGILHRDLKPSNVFVEALRDRARRVRLLDFGVAKLRDRPVDHHSTQTNAILGTIVYMAPEQLRDAKRVDGRADIHAFGAVLYESLCGRTPYDAPSMIEVVSKILTERPAPLPSFDDPRLRAYGKLAMACLARDMDARPDWDVIHEALRKARGPQLKSTMPARPASRPSPAPSSLLVKLLPLSALLGVALTGVLYWALIQHPSAGSVPARVDAESGRAALVDVVVRSDVSDGELIVDGHSVGTSPNGQWNLRVPAGDHVMVVRRHGLSVTTQHFTARPFTGAAVDLNAPDEAKVPASADDSTP